MDFYIENKSFYVETEFFIKSDKVSSVGVRNGELLLMGKRRDNGKWTLPGGHADPGEEKFECAAREMLEESGIKVEPSHLEFLGEEKITTYTGKKKTIAAFQYRSKGEKTTMSNDPDKEVHQWHWIDISEGIPGHIKENLHSPKNVVLQKMGLMKSAGHKYIRRYRKGDKYIYVYEDKKGREVKKEMGKYSAMPKAEVKAMSNKALWNAAGKEHRQGFHMGIGPRGPNYMIKRRQHVTNTLRIHQEIEARGYKDIHEFARDKGFEFGRQETENAEAESKMGEKKHQESNGMGPPPPENRAFIKPGSKVTIKDTRKFVSHFEGDFKALKSMDTQLKKAGATHFASRLKDSTSLLNKMHGRWVDGKLDQVSDIIGARGLARTIKDQRTMLFSIQNSMEIVKVNDSAAKGRADGYRAIHVIFKTPSGKMGELQLKTHRQQVFSGFTHDSIYKAPAEVKNDPEVIKYSKELSDYLYLLDSSGGPEDKSKRPSTPDSMKERGLEFPWPLMDEFGTGAAAELSEAKGMKFFAVVRDHGTKENIRVLEFDNFGKAAAYRKANEGKHEVPIGYSKSKEEFFETFSEYRMKGYKPGKATEKSFGKEYLFIKGGPEFYVADLIKAKGHKYIRKYKRGNKWIYIYHNENRAKRISQEHVDTIKKLAEHGDKHAKALKESIKPRNEKKLDLLRQLADEGDKHAVDQLKQFGIQREKEKLEEKLAPQLSQRGDKLDETLQGPTAAGIKAQMMAEVKTNIFDYLSRHTGNPYKDNLVSAGVTAESIIRSVSDKNTVRGMLTELDKNLKKVDLAHRGLSRSQNNAAAAAGGYGNLAYGEVIQKLESADILPRGYSEVHKRGKELPDPAKVEEAIKRQKAERKEKERRELGALKGTMAYQMASLAGGRDVIEKTRETDRVIKEIFGKSLKKEDWPYDFSAHGVTVKITALNIFSSSIEMSFEARDSSGNLITNQWSRTWNKRSGAPHIHNDLLVVKKDARGGVKIGSLINMGQQRLMKSRAPTNGHITVDAALGVGGYNWSNQAFSFSSKGQLDAFRQGFKRFLADKGIPLSDADMQKFKEPCHFSSFHDGKLYEKTGLRESIKLSAKQLETRSLSGKEGEFPLTSGEIRAGKADRMAVHAGKAYMLGKSWSGIWRANKKTSAQKFFENYAQMKLKTSDVLEAGFRSIISRVKERAARAAPRIHGYRTRAG